MHVQRSKIAKVPDQRLSADLGRFGSRTRMVAPSTARRKYLWFLAELPRCRTLPPWATSRLEHLHATTRQEMDFEPIVKIFHPAGARLAELDADGIAWPLRYLAIAPRSSPRYAPRSSSPSQTTAGESEGTRYLAVGSASLARLSFIVT